ncbi:SAM-dependent methyltransferase [Streptomyces sp. NPDC101225]|uniref:SAM-dependent methyltransferase n=1 Tax=Streptomyces sp. NPDC101225 TaxID=3366135 RepID=UPI00380F0BF7
MTTTGRKELQHPRFARQYLKMAAESDRRGGAAHRDRLLTGLAGRVLEVGAGQGRNFRHYPDDVTEVVAVEPDDTLPGAPAEAAHVLRPRGELHFYEHVRSPRRWAGLLEDAIIPLWSRAGGGCHPNRDTETAIRAAGFTVREICRFGFSFSPFVPDSLHIIGTAVRP